MHMRNKQCFGLLGANGAGKSTIISMLTGLYAPSGGTALVRGFDIRTDMQRIQESIGVCPQHDVTWPSLTVTEHLLLYARLKGASKREEKKIVQAALHAVELHEHAGKRSSQLSGGQRRRLSIAISFIGDPRVVALDEPTTGVDPATRQAIENLIMEEKRKRCIILTTHLMPEAEKLSDRIGIMSHGQLRTIGTANALKAKHSQGFKLLVVVSDRQQAVGFVSKRFPAAVVESEVNARITFSFPAEAQIPLPTCSR